MKEPNLSVYFFLNFLGSHIQIINYLPQVQSLTPVKTAIGDIQQIGH